jgi:hypothetical protein
MASKIRELPHCWSWDHLLNRAFSDPVKLNAASHASMDTISLYTTFERVYGKVSRRLVGDSVRTHAHAATVPVLTESPNERRE